MPKILLDIDGVILDFIRAKRDVCRARFDERDISDADLHPDRIKETFPDPAELKVVRDELYNVGDAATISLVPGARDGLAELRKLGAVELLSERRSERNKAASQELRGAHGIMEHATLVSQAEEKIPHLAGATLYVDDSLRKLRAYRAAYPDLPLGFFDQTGIADAENPAPGEGIAVLRDWDELVRWARGVVSRSSS